MQTPKKTEEPTPIFPHLTPKPKYRHRIQKWYKPDGVIYFALNPSLNYLDKNMVKSGINLSTQHMDLAFQYIPEIPEHELNTHTHTHTRLHEKSMVAPRPQ